MEKFDTLIYATKVRIGDGEFTIGEMLGISQEAISDEYVTHASRLAYLGMLMAKAEVAYEEARNSTQEIHADTDLAVREEFEANSIKYTEAKVLANVQLDEEYAKAVEAELTAMHNYKLMRAIVEAMRARGEMLISLGAQLRQEWDVTSMSLARTKAELLTRKRNNEG